MSIKKQKLDQTYYLEIKGQPDRIYADVVRFGPEVDFAVDGHATTSSWLRSPAKVYPDRWPRTGFPSSTSVHRVLDDNYRMVENLYDSGKVIPPSMKIPECLIGVETNQNKTTSRDAIYQLTGVVVVRMYMHDHPTRNYYQLEFGGFKKLWATWS